MVQLNLRQAEILDCLLSDEKEPHFIVGGFFLYRNNYRETLVKVLKNTFPVCERLLGDAFFRGMSLFYIKQHPSSSFSLDAFGDKLPNFMRTFKPLDSLSYLPCMAELELKIQKIMLGPANALFSWEALKNIRPEEMPNLIFRMPLNSDLIYAAFPIDILWEVNQPDVLLDKPLNLPQEDVFLFLSRRDMDLCINRLSKTEWQLLNQLRQGKSLQELDVVLSPEEDILLLHQCIQKRFIHDFI